MKPSVDFLKRFAERAVAFDVETHLIQPGLLAPPLVCGSYAVFGNRHIKGGLLNKNDTLDLLEELLNSDRIIVGANIPYDFLVCAVERPRILAQIFKAYNEYRVFDILIAEALHAIAEGTLGYFPDTGKQLTSNGKTTGRYSLENVLRITTGRIDAKENDTWRLRYAELENIRLSQWPKEARQYPVDDACNTLDAALVQINRNRNLHDLPNQVKAGWAMHLGAAWGLNVNPASVDKLEAKVLKQREEGRTPFAKRGLLWYDKKEDRWKKHQATTRRLVAEAYGANSPCLVCAGTGKAVSEKTKKEIQCVQCSATGYDVSADTIPKSDPSKRFPIGAVGMGRDVLFESGDDFLMAFADYDEKAKLVTTYIPWLRKGIGPDGKPIPLNLRPDTLKETGRASYSLEHQLPRDMGVRECIEARPGYVLVSCDWSSIELSGHAQSCRWLLSYSKLGDAINDGLKPHDALAAKVMGISYDEFMKRKPNEPKLKDYRQASKAINFGCPGGMGAAKIVLQQRQQGPDTPHPTGPMIIKTYKGSVPGYKGLRFCLLVGDEEKCGHTKVTEYKGKPISPTCAKCIESAEQIRGAWFQQWAENRAYFKLVAETIEDKGEIVQHISERVRGGLSFTSAANSYFQGLVSEGAKLAYYMATEESLTDKNSPLYGSHMIYLYHDEIFGELVESRAHEGAMRIREIMIEAMKRYIPEIAVDAEPAIMRIWYKQAEPDYDESGRLIPWEPEND